MTIDVTKLPESFRNFSMIIIQIPFWYIAIYIFNRPLYEKNDILLIGSTCLGLTLISFILGGIMFAEQTVEKNDNHKNEQNLDYNKSEEDSLKLVETMLPLFTTTLILSIIIFLGYLIKEFFDFRMHWYSFLLFHFGILVLFSIMKLVRFFRDSNN